MGRNALQVAELVDGETKRDTDFRIELGRLSGKMPDQEIQLRLVAKRTENEFVRQRGILRAESSAVEQFGGEGALFDAQESVERNRTGRRGQLPW